MYILWNKLTMAWNITKLPQFHIQITFTVRFLSLEEDIIQDLMLPDKPSLDSN